MQLAKPQASTIQIGRKDYEKAQTRRALTLLSPGCSTKTLSKRSRAKSTTPPRAHAPIAATYAAPLGRSPSECTSSRIDRAARHSPAPLHAWDTERVHGMKTRVRELSLWIRAVYLNPQPWAALMSFVKKKNTVKQVLSGIQKRTLNTTWYQLQFTYIIFVISLLNVTLCILIFRLTCFAQAAVGTRLICGKARNTRVGLVSEAP